MAALFSTVPTDVPIMRTFMGKLVYLFDFTSIPENGKLYDPGSFDCAQGYHHS